MLWADVVRGTSPSEVQRVCVCVCVGAAAAAAEYWDELLDVHN